MTEDRSIRVGVNGYGVIGKRVADAVRLQPDMELVGVADVVTDYRIEMAANKEMRVFASVPDTRESMQQAGITVAGTLDDLLGDIDAVVDCTPKGIGAKNLETYRDHGVKALLQGGEKHEVTGHSFVAQANYASALDRDVTRVVSCNTTSTVRTLVALDDAELLERARGVLVRRATDPWESDHSGIMNTVVPEKHIPSHQGPDAQTVVPDLDVVTIAAKAAHTQSHQHFWIVDLARQADPDEILEAFHNAPRIATIRADEGIVALNSTIELMKDLERPRGDMWEVAVWEDILTVEQDQAYYTYQVDNQAIVIPENIDAIRALTGAERDADTSIEKTNEALGIRRSFTGK